MLNVVEGRQLCVKDYRSTLVALGSLRLSKRAASDCVNACILLRELLCVYFHHSTFTINNGHPRTFPTSGRLFVGF